MLTKNVIKNHMTHVAVFVGTVRLSNRILGCSCCCAVYIFCVSSSRLMAALRSEIVGCSFIEVSVVEQ
jgi:hypothetical protein